jgi:phage FluMu gp28-like protein
MKKCPKCGTQHSKPGKFCSRTCANSRGQRTEEFKKIVSEKLTGRKIPREIIEKTIKSKNQISSFGLPNTLCKICGKDTGSKTRKTCSKECYSKLCKLQSQQNPKCGGQKHTHRSKIKNINGDVFISESSFEAKLSEILNSLGILWIRPNFVLYLDNDHNQRRNLTYTLIQRTII